MVCYFCVGGRCITNYNFFELDEIHLFNDYLDYIFELWNFTPNSHMETSWTFGYKIQLYIAFPSCPFTSTSESWFLKKI